MRRGFECEVTPGSASSSRFRLTEARSDQPLRFEPPEREIDRRPQHRVFRVPAELFDDWHAVRGWPEPENRQENELLEFANRRW